MKRDTDRSNNDDKLMTEGIASDENDNDFKEENNR